MGSDLKKFVNPKFLKTIDPALMRVLFVRLREGAQEVDLISLQDAVRQVSRDFLSRKERREFLDRLGRFAEEAQSSRTVISRVRGFLEGQGKELDALDEIFDALLSDDRFKPKIDQAAALEIEKRVEVQAAQIDARAKERIKELSLQLGRTSPRAIWQWMLAHPGQALRTCSATPTRSNTASYRRHRGC